MSGDIELKAAAIRLVADYDRGVAEHKARAKGSVTFAPDEFVEALRAALSPPLELKGEQTVSGASLPAHVASATETEGLSFAGKWRKQPVVIEAYQFHNRVGTDERPDWIKAAAEAGVIQFLQPRHAPGYLLIHTLEGQMRGDVDDWIIKGVKGEIYPCKPDIFAATYEAAGPSDCAAGSAERKSEWRPTHRHLARGTEYRAIGKAHVQSSQLIQEDDWLVIYEGADERLWARPPSEFNDGRFAALSDNAPPICLGDLVSGADSTDAPAFGAAEDAQRKSEAVNWKAEWEATSGVNIRLTNERDDARAEVKRLMRALSQTTGDA